MTPERIAEIERELPDYSGDGDELAEMRELIRLARLGLRVEGAPTKAIIAGMFKQNSRITVSMPDEWIGKRVALVVVEDSK